MPRDREPRGGRESWNRSAAKSSHEYWEKVKREKTVAEAAEKAQEAAADAAMGFRASTDKEIVLGAPPCVIDILPTDSPECRFAKSQWNAGNREAFADSQFSGFAAAADRFGLIGRLAKANKDVNEYCRKKETRERGHLDRNHLFGSNRAAEKSSEKGGVSKICFRDGSCHVFKK